MAYAAGIHGADSSVTSHPSTAADLLAKAYEKAGGARTDTKSPAKRKASVGTLDGFVLRDQESSSSKKKKAMIEE